MTATRPPFPTVIDSSMMSAWRACRRKIFLEYLEHWKTKNLSVHLHAGKAFARGLEVAREEYYANGVPEHEAIPLGLQALVTAYGDFECPPDSAKSLERMMGAFEYYFSEYPMGTDTARPSTLPGGKLGIEFSFASPIDIDHPETGEPLLYCGRFDMICDYAGGRFGEDDKTTSSLGASWPKQWDLRSQFTGYCWGAERAGFPLQGFLVRGVSILKTKYDTMQALTYRPKWMIERWYEQLLRDVARLKAMWETGVFDYSLDHACNEYSGCEFRQVCLSQDPDPWLRGSFQRKVWDPVNRREIILEN